MGSEILTALIGFAGVVLSAVIASRRSSQPTAPNTYAANPVTAVQPGVYAPGHPMPGSPMAMPGSPVPMPGAPAGQRPGMPGQPGAPMPGLPGAAVPGQMRPGVAIPGQPVMPYPMGGYQVPMMPVPPPPTKPSISLWLGLGTLIAWFLPIVGIPLALISIGKGVNDLATRSRTLARTGIYVSLIGLMAAVANSAIGAYAAG